MTIIVSGSDIGFRKIDFTHLVRAQFGYGLSEGKAFTDAILDGKVVTFEVDDEEGQHLLHSMQGLGARASISYESKLHESAA